MRIGVTGIFASGKGTVCELFRQMGAEVIDTDILAREITEPGHEALKKIIDVFGKKYLNRDGTLDRRRFARDVFSNSESTDLLNSITHPIILDLMLSRSSGPGTYMVNTPLLFESGFDKSMEKNIVVVARVDQAVERGKKRDGISGDEIKQRLNHQLSLNEKIKLADYVIDNSGTLENTRRQVIEIWNILKDMNNR
ncbi:MAG TPA: dephospho-CoA kinase [Spirochaetota bacterium]|nr:dephospho-CoA kinase [Spirochaetota bacterium]HPI87872.1 dephospho-CoA kinase [Spirochaetota bacterium]HPR47396.1 dephospho-CoA kinase [Spirochaetota bacterium]